MSTRSGIGILQPDGKTVRYIYCHWDGYIENNGEILYNYYNTPAKVNELINLGFLSSLGEKIGHQVDFNDYDSHKGQCVAYHRDRGEDLEIHTGTIDDLRGWQEYNYLYDSNKREWFVEDGYTDGEFVPLANLVTHKNTTTSGGMNPSTQEVEDFFLDASTNVRRSRRIMGATEDEEFEDPRIDEADELQARVEDDFDYVITGIERLGREGMLDEAISLLNTLADTLDSAIGIIGNDFESGISPEEEEI